MVFSTPCCRNRHRSDWRVGALAGWLFWWALSGLALAADKAPVTQAALRASANGYVLDATLDISLNRTLEDALAKGITLPFLLDVEISRPRSWWLDDDIGEASRKLRIYYHLLLRRYVVENGYTTRTVDTLAAALTQLGRVEDWQILERGALKPGQRYDARLRLRLDTAQLAKPLSISAVTGDKWEFSTAWHQWSFDAPPPKPAMP